MVDTGGKSSLSPAVNFRYLGGFWGVLQADRFKQGFWDRNGLPLFAVLDFRYLLLDGGAGGLAQLSGEAP